MLNTEQQLQQVNSEILGTPVWELPPTFTMTERAKPNATIFSGPFEIMFFNGFAVKTFSNDHPHSDYTAQIMIAKEGAVLYNLNHPHIANSSGFLMLPDGRYGVMLPVLDSNLDIRLRTNQFTYSSLVDMIDPICSAAAYAHDRNIVHLDIKPSNILFSGELPYLADWGGCSTPEVDSTHSRGTFLFNAPEQQLATDPTQKDLYHPFTDTYAIGLMLYRIITANYTSPTFTDGSRAVYHPFKDEQVLSVGAGLPEQSKLLAHLRIMTSRRMNRRIPTSEIPAALRYALEHDMNKGIINPDRTIPKKSQIPVLKLKRFEDEVTLSWLTREHTDIIEDFSLVNAPKPIWNPNPKWPKAPKPFICLDNRARISDKTPFVGMPFINI